jgi:hypothetical protein
MPCAVGIGTGILYAILAAGHCYSLTAAGHCHTPSGYGYPSTQRDPAVNLANYKLTRAQPDAPANQDQTAYQDKNTHKN